MSAWGRGMSGDGMSISAQNMKNSERMSATIEGASAGKPDDLQTDVLIRQIIVAQDSSQTNAAADEGAQVKHPRRLFRKSRTPEAEAAQLAGDTQAGSGNSRLASWAAQLRNIRLSRKTVLLVLLVGIMLWRPWLLPVTFLLIFSTLLIAYFSLGPDRVAEIVIAGWKRLHARRPELAEHLRQRAEAVAERIDACLDQLPEKWTDGIYVPDLSLPDPEEANRPDPFERLSREA